MPIAGAPRDVARGRTELLLENALLRQQLIVLGRTAPRPQFTPTDRRVLVLLASRLPTWANALLLAQPATVLRWHRAGFRLAWRRQVRRRAATSPLPAQTIAPIEQMATENGLWGADRIRGELLKLNIRLSKRTIQRYRANARLPRPRGRNPS